jgi:hypothetical protein
MIIWLASYPRSGNTLLRQILNQCAQRQSYEQYTSSWSSSFDAEAAETAGLLFYKGSWERFHRRAGASPEVFLIKTHDLPRDDQPALYVVRDGRSASLSYFEFLRTYQPEANTTLEQVVCGDNAFGGWSDHCKHWMQRRAPTLVLRFEELVDCTDELLARMMRFIGHERPVASWRNPQQRLAQLEPKFFREGATTWRPKSPWDESADLLFFAHHGEQMRVLNYYAAEELQRLHSHPLRAAYCNLAPLTARIALEKRTLQETYNTHARTFARTLLLAKIGLFALVGTAAAGILLAAIYWP